MNPLEAEARQGLGSEAPDPQSTLNPEMKVVLFDTLDILSSSDPNQGTWIR